MQSGAKNIRTRVRTIAQYFSQRNEVKIEGANIRQKRKPRRPAMPSTTKPLIYSVYRRLTNAKYTILLHTSIWMSGYSTIFLLKIPQITSSSLNKCRKICQIYQKTSTVTTSSKTYSISAETGTKMTVIDSTKMTNKPIPDTSNLKTV